MAMTLSRYERDRHYLVMIECTAPSEIHVANSGSEGQSLCPVKEVIAPIIWSYMEGATFLKDRTRFIQIFSPYGSLKIYNDTNF